MEDHEDIDERTEGFDGKSTATTVTVMIWITKVADEGVRVRATQPHDVVRDGTGPDVHIDLHVAFAYYSDSDNDE